MSLGQDGPPTRTRLPEPPPGTGGPARRPQRSSRSLVTVVGVVVLLIAAIAFANRGGGSPSGSPGSGGQGGTSNGARSQPTSPTGTKPVDGKNAGIPTGYARTDQGAESAGANYAVALVSADILNPDRRHQIVQRLFTDGTVNELQAKLDDAYSTDFLAKLGLDENGNAAEDMVYVSRTVPVGTTTTDFRGDTATVEVWCTGVFGTAGEGSTNPVVNDWFTMTLKLRWADNDWKVESFSQKDGPAPVNSDRTASTADEIANAVKQYGGFTYAR
ncbi:hypothetical protein [Actinacidiphila glaucinigra]|uniref:hypothetical protein n=1 Tax=Actinacidiphila glaucinigra TaxID=235986 RepID=UPI00371ED10C